MWWSWDESDGGDDKYVCHICGNDNSKFHLNESEEPKKGKLFIPRRISGENSRWIQWNKEQPIKDGVRINQYDIETGKKEGYWEEYWDNGQLGSKGSYINGKKEGIWEGYWINGQLGSKGSYNNGKKEGIWEYYYDNGQLWFKGFLKNDLREGVWEWYYMDGKLWSKGSYKNGKLVKTITESEEPKKGKLFVPRNIKGRYIKWNNEQPIKDGKRINQYNIDTVKKEGYWEEYFSNGQLEYKGSYINGKEEGYWELYHENGKLYSKGEYKNGKEDGIWEDYYPDGNLHSKGSYKNGKRDGYWYEYWFNGKLYSKGLYKNGKKSGILNKYNEYGKLIDQIKY